MLIRFVNVAIACGVAIHAIFLVQPSHAAAQARASISPTPVKHASTCPACRVVLTKLITLGSASDPESPGSTPTIARDSKSRYYLLGHDRVKVLVYGPDGKYVASIGRAGDGPGEFGRPDNPLSGVQDIWIGARDSLYIFHSRFKIEVFDPAWKHIRSVTIPSSNRAGQAVLRDGSILLSSNLQGPSQIGHLLHVFSPTGAPVRSFGGDGRPAGTGAPKQLPGRIEISPRGDSFWSQNGYRLQNWSLDGALLRDFDIQDVSWWPPPPAPKPGEVTRSVDGRSFVPSPGDVFMAGIDSAGVLWMNGILVGNRGTGNPRSTYRLEAVDPVNGSILTSQQHQNPAQRIIRGSNLSFSATESVDGVVSYTVFALRLIRP